MHFITIFILILLSQITSKYTNKLSLAEQYEVEDLAYQLTKDNGNFIKSLFDFSSVSGGMNCFVCSFAIDVLKNYLLQKNGFEKFYALVQEICHFTSIDNRVCDGAIEHYKDIVIDSVIKRFVNGDYICSLINICQDTTDYETIEDFAERVLKDKPETKPKEIVKTKNDDDYYKVLQVTDIHLDMEYKEGTVANCILPICCRELADDDLVPVKQVFAGLYGTTGKCDANVETVKAFAARAKETNPDYIMFTGDNIAHSVWKVTQDEVITATRVQIEIIQNEFGMDTPIYPAIGNHEKAPVDEFHGEETELLEGLAEIFRPYLTDDAYETFRKYGYYTMLVKNNLRIISLNCLLCDSFNWNLLYDSEQPRQMFKWLESVLSEAEKNGEIVHIMDHIPLESTQHTLQCTGRLKILIDRYQNIIRGLFSGHSHSEYLSMVHEYYTPEKASQINYICSGLTTYSSYQPSFRVYLVDKKELYVQDFIQYRMNLVESNEQRTPIWFIPYQATELFGVDSMNDVETISQYKITPEYVQHRSTDIPGSEESSHNPNTIYNAQCQFDNDNMEDIFNCSGYSVLSEGYFYYILNQLQTKWLK